MTITDLIRTSPLPARLETELLLMHVLNTSRSTLIAYPERTLDTTQHHHFTALLARRMRGEPIAYLLNEKEFWSLPLHVTPDTLIPRPETELLVECMLQQLPHSTQHIADLGTGSGAIALALAHERPNWQIAATDRSPATLAIAQNNAQRLGITHITFHCGDWHTALPPHQYNAIASNPPYLRADDPHLQQGDVRYEPLTALTAGPDGLLHLRHIITTSPTYLVTGGKLFLEHGYDQASPVRQLLHDAGYVDITTCRDLAGHERMTFATIRKGDTTPRS